MKWINQTGPQYSLYTARIGDRMYEIRRKKGFSLWRLFLREHPHEAQRTIFAGDTKRECQEYAEQFEETLS